MSKTETQPKSAIDIAIDAAKAAALAAAPQGGAVAAAVPGRKLQMADLAGSSMDVTSWLQVNEYGLTIDKSSTLLSELTVEIDMTAVVPVFMVRYGKSPAQYKKSYDGHTTFGSPKPWEAQLAEAQRLDATCKGQYSTVEVPMKLIGDVVLDKDKKTVPSGTMIGHTPSVTGFKPFMKFYNELEKAGRQNETAVKVKIGFEKRSGNGNTWGVTTFTALTN